MVCLAWLRLVIVPYSAMGLTGSVMSSSDIVTPTASLVRLLLNVAPNRLEKFKPNCSSSSFCLSPIISRLILVLVSLAGMITVPVVAV